LLRQRWAKLLFLHWAVPPEEVRPLLPPGLELDTFEGRAFIGLVPFTMAGIRPSGLPPLPGLSRTHEVNVRTYVHRVGRDPGVWFFSLDAAHGLGVRFARRFFHLPYHHARMSLSSGDGSSHHFRSERLGSGPERASCEVRYRPRGPVEPARPGTLEFFLAERYILYAPRAGSLYVGRVHHAPYPLQEAEAEIRTETLLAAAGIRRPDEAPIAHYAEQVSTRIYPIRRVGP
jgi:uncharacterized protein YqjF (DUF2071 family)